ncbi:MAG: DUF1189 family protein [Legionella sp.]|uniref:DUF1189 family protein n=1 Tax=Legionella sp. TaxID=459 RepID=UPI00283C811B|nr:DUF1189 family protein [Legionella sp.]
MGKEKTALKPIDTPVYGYWSALYRSFYSRRLYVDVGKRWKGFGVLYLLLVVAILSVPFFFRMSISLDESFKEQIVNPLLKIPVFYIQNGNVLFDKPMPYFVKNDKGQTVVIIDTTGIINDFTAQYPYLNILINKNQIAFRIPNPQLFTMSKETPPSRSTPIVQTFDKGSNLVFDGKKMVEANSVTGLKYASQAVLYPIIVGIFFSIFLVFFFVFALLGQTFSSIFFSFKISFVASCRMLMVAGTPMLFVLMTILSLNSVFTGLGFILFFLLIAYYSFALYALRAESRQVALL